MIGSENVVFWWAINDQLFKQTIVHLELASFFTYKECDIQTGAIHLSTFFRASWVFDPTCTTCQCTFPMGCGPAHRSFPWQ
jgi:hypothetical protein